MARDQHEHRAWVRMPSGRRLDLLDPTPFDWDDSDLALGLARTYRWGGHSAWPLPLSVAQHSLTVMHVRIAACAAAGLTLPPVAALRELLHDAEEGLLGFDCISPLKPFLGDAFKTLSQKLDAAVFLRYGLPGWTPKEHAAHKLADRLAAASEAVHIAGWSAKEVQQTLKITVPPLQDDPLHPIYGGTPWQPWPPALAAERFLAELERLKTLSA